MIGISLSTWVESYRCKYMMKRKLFLYLLKIIILVILFFGAVYFENAQQQRLYLLIGVFMLYIANSFCRVILKHDNFFFVLSFIIDITLVFILEYNSRLLINYFFHSFYIIILLEAALTLRLKKGIIIGAVTVLVSLIKYGYLLYYKFNLSNVSQMAFFLMVNVLILVIASFAQYNKEERVKKDTLYRELLDTYKQLKQYSDEVSRLTVVEERNRIARDIHDTLGHNITALIMQLQMAEHLLKEDISKAESLIRDAVKTAKGGMTDIRQVVETLRGVDSAQNPVDAIRRLVNDFAEKTGVKIKLSINNIENIDLNSDQKIINSLANKAVLHIIQEGLTNAIRHGQGTQASVEIDYSADLINFCIVDNGSGSKSLKEGYGLKGIRERVNAFNGFVEFGDRSDSNGFYVKGFLCLEEKNDKSTNC